ncbi:gluconolaconase [Scytonema sp. HK-05]|nr:gluconolaconase [Scytonema sp. HK-05]
MTLSILNYAILLLLVSCNSVKLDATSTLSRAESVPVTASTPPNLFKTTPQPSAYLVKPIQIFKSPKYSEGVVIDREGNLYFSETKAGTITVLPPITSPRVWAKVEGANGHKIMPDGTHIIAAKNSVMQLDANGKLLKVVVNEFNGKPLEYPNDITIDEQGGFYFTDSGDSNPQTPTGAVYYVSPEQKITRVINRLAFANGILLSRDGKRLFVSESHKNRILAYDVLSPGKVGLQKVFAELPIKQGEQIDNKPDGICQDSKGNLYVAHYGMRQVQVLNSNGHLIGQYSSGNLTTSNCVFGGLNQDYLFVTGGMETEDGSGGIYRLDLGVR